MDDFVSCCKVCLLFSRTVQPGQTHTVSLCGPDGSVKYTLTLYDNATPKASSTPTVALLVPLGQETDWLFVSSEGNQEVDPLVVYFLS